MKSSFGVVSWFLFATLLSTAAAAAQDVPPAPPAVPACPGKAAELIPGTPPAVTITNPSSTCPGDGAPCGFLLAYNPPQTRCIDVPNKCCVNQAQQSYIQSYSCQPDPAYPHDPARNRCTPGPRIPFGPLVMVKVTTDCVNPGTNNNDPCRLPPPF